MIVCYCNKKIRDKNGEVAIYELVDQRRDSILIRSWKLKELLISGEYHCLNLILTKDKQIKSRQKTENRSIIKKIALYERNITLKKYSGELYGKCIETSDRIVKRLSTVGIKAYTFECWCVFDDENYGSDRPWGEHTLVITDKGLVVDVTADQFNCAMEDKYKELEIGTKLPNKMTFYEPSWEDYDY